VTITLNGDSVELAEHLTIATLLAHLEIDPRRVAVEHNAVVLKRGLFETTEVRDGDQVEIVNFVGGGCVPSLRTYE
jgi:thiamine biosynthesis protein ThiS